MSTFFQLIDTLNDSPERRTADIPVVARPLEPRSALLLNPVVQRRDLSPLPSPQAANDDHPSAPPLAHIG